MSDKGNSTAQFRFGLNYFLLFSVFAVITPYFQLLLDLRGFDKQQIGFIFGVFEAVGLGAPLVWGFLSDQVRHRRALLSGVILGAAAAFMLFGFVEVFWAAAAAAACFGLFYRPIVPLTDGFVLRYQSEHGGDYGRPRTAGSVAFIVVIFALERFGISGESRAASMILGSVAVLAVCHAASSLTMPLTDRERAERAARRRQRGHIDWRILRSRSFLLFVFVAFLGRFAMMAYYSFFTLFLKEEIGYAKPGDVWVVGPIAEIPVIFFSGWFLRRLGVRNLFAIGIGATAVRLAGYAVTPGMGMIWPLQTLHAFTFGAFHVASMRYLDRLAPSDMKQSAMAVYVSLSNGTAFILGSIAGGAMIEHFGYRVTYAAFAAVALVGFVLAFVCLREPEDGHAVARA